MLSLSSIDAHMRSMTLDLSDPGNPGTVIAWRLFGDAQPGLLEGLRAQGLGLVAVDQILQS